MSKLEELMSNLRLAGLDQDLLKLALTHSSWANSRGEENNERLEFLGDAVLNLVITEDLYRRYSSYDEGMLSKLRASLVSNDALSFYAQQLKLHKYASFRGKPSKRILANLMEALVGAIYLSRGLEAVREFYCNTLKPWITTYELKLSKVNWKGILQEYTQRVIRELPKYVSVRENGSFKVQVWIRGRLMGEGSGHSLKEADRVAAKEAIKRLSTEGGLRGEK